MYMTTNVSETSCNVKHYIDQYHSVTWVQTSDPLHPISPSFHGNLDRFRYPFSGEVELKTRFKREAYQPPPCPFNAVYRESTRKDRRRPAPRNQPGVSWRERPAT